MKFLEGVKVFDKVGVDVIILVDNFFVLFCISNLVMVILM